MGDGTQPDNFFKNFFILQKAFAFDFTFLYLASELQLEPK